MVFYLLWILQEKQFCNQKFSVFSFLATIRTIFCRIIFSSMPILDNSGPFAICKSVILSCKQHHKKLPTTQVVCVPNKEAQINGNSLHSLTEVFNTTDSCCQNKSSFPHRSYPVLVFSIVCLHLAQEPFLGWTSFHTVHTTRRENLVMPLVVKL